MSDRVAHISVTDMGDHRRVVVDGQEYVLLHDAYRMAAEALAGEQERAIGVAYLRRQIAFSSRTFGPGPRTAGILDHIRKELLEVEAAPADVVEWCDLVILALDGAWRAGHSPEEIIAAIHAKLARNEARTWPDWRTAAPGTAIEHVRGSDV